MFHNSVVPKSALAFVGCVVAVAALAPSGAGDALSAERSGAPVVTCPKGKVLAESREGRLVRRGRRLYGCTAGRRPMILAWSSLGAYTWSKATLSGHVAAAQLRFHRTATYVVRVVDLKRQRLCYQETIGTGRVAHGTLEDAGEPVRDLVLHPTGSVAYIAGPGQGPRTATGEDLDDVAPWSGYEVGVIDRNGARHVAAGEDIELGSLAIAGRHVTWRQGGQERSAALGRGGRCDRPLPPL